MLLCNITTLSQVYGNETYVYDLSEFPGLHDSDIAFAFYAPEQSTRRTSLLSFWSLNVTVADFNQDYITNFAMDGRRGAANQA
jgi:carboxylesterase type B